MSRIHIMDVNSREVPESELREVQNFFYFSNNLFCVIDLDGKFIRINPAFEKVFERPSQEILKYSLLDLLQSDDREALQKELARAHTEQSAIFQHVARFLSQSGTTKYLSWNISPHFSDNWGVHFYCHATDVSELEKKTVAAFKALETARRHFQYVAESVPGMIYQILEKNDGGRQFTYINNGARELLGFDPETLLQDASQIRKLIHPEDLENYEQAIAFRNREQTPFVWEGRIISGLGAVKWIQASARLSRQEPEGDLWDGLIIDITDKKNAEQTITEQRERILQASKMATLGQMAGGIAHEINNPLTIVVGRAQQLKELATQDGPIDRNLLETLASRIEATAFRIVKIVKGLRSFSREGNQDPFAKTSLKSILEDTLCLCENRFRMSEVSLKTTSLSEDIVLECRPVQISQILLNLLNNAYDAVIHANEKWIQVNVENLPETVKIKIIDSGSGVPLNLRDKIPQPFMTTKPQGDGTGLGLTICNGMVESHQGKLYFDFEAPHTTVVVELPKVQNRTVALEF